MSVHTTKATKAIYGDTDPFEIRQLDAPIVADHHVLDVTGAIDKRADLSTNFMGKLGELASEFGCEYLVRGNPPGVKLFDAAKLIWLEARGVSDYVLDGSCPPVTQARTPVRQATNCSAIEIELKLQEE